MDVRNYSCGVIAQTDARQCLERAGFGILQDLHCWPLRYMMPSNAYGIMSAAGVAAEIVPGSTVEASWNIARLQAIWRRAVIRWLGEDMTSDATHPPTHAPPGAE